MPKSSAEMTSKRKVSPATWKALVDNVPVECRCEVAHIVWWDWFAGRVVSERWPHLDKYLKRPAWKKPTDEEILRGLRICGYSEKHALSRIGNKGNTVKANKA